MDPDFDPAKLAGRVYRVRGEHVMLDSDLALIYGVTTKRLNQQVRRNAERFPSDFMFQLTEEEVHILRLQIATLSLPGDPNLRSQFATLRRGTWGRHRKYLPFAFTHVGAATLPAVLRSPRAVQAHIAVMRTFDALARAMALHKRLAERLDHLERRFTRHDAQLQEVFAALRELMDPKPKPHPRIGFKP